MKPPKAGEWVLLDTGWACAVVVVAPNGVIVDAAPILRALIGEKLEDVEKRYRVLR